jgi:polyisoprenoid-binding protein YceI
LKQTRIQQAATIAAVVGTTAVTGAAVIAFAPGPALLQPHMIHAAKAAAADGSFTIDPMHTLASFEIEHMGLSHVRGRFDKMEGHIVADSGDLSKSSVTFTAQTESIDTNVAPRDADLRSPSFFDTDKYPTLTFQSTRIHKDGGHYVADGQLTIKGVTHPVSIPFQYYGPIQDPFGGTRLGIVADPLVINRSDYGITWDHKMPDGSPQLADSVTVLLSVEATQDKPAAPAP